MRSEVASDVRFRLSLAVLGILYVVGALGITSKMRSAILGLSALNLCLTALLLGLNAEALGRRGYVALAIVGLIGFFVEVLGVATGAVFGAYEYTARLGPSSLGVPWVIGLNWAMLIHAIHAGVGRLGLPTMAKSAVGASAMTLFDWIMEPAAIALGYWRWSSPTVPMRNYAAWWVLSLALFAFVEKASPRPRNRLAPWVLVAMVGFS
ncbi:MAG: carotenoid biosynthesis protein [Polyangiaceae bacterium]